MKCLFWIEDNFYFVHFVSKDTVMNREHFPQEFICSCCFSLTWSHNPWFVAIISSAKTNCDVTGGRLWLQGQNKQQEQVTSKTQDVSFQEKIVQMKNGGQICLSLRRKYLFRFIKDIHWIARVNLKRNSLWLYQEEIIYSVAAELLSLASNFSFD